MEKKQKQFDRMIGEWQAKCRDLQQELENSQRDGRQYSADVYKLKTHTEELNDNIEALKRENRNLAGSYS